MDHIGRGIATLGLAAGCAVIAWATKDDNHATLALVLGTAIIWWRSGR